MHFDYNINNIIIKTLKQLSRNGRAYALAKEARTRSYVFSHIDQTRTDGYALRRIGSSVLHLI